MADSAASPQSKPRRAASKKQRQGAVSSETEKKLARAARSAQRLAQLSGVIRDDSTLDLFPDDPTRATLEAMNIDIRQGTLDGFELPNVVLQAVGALDDNTVDKAARRAPRVAKSEAPVPVNGQLSGFDVEPAMPVDAGVAGVVETGATTGDASTGDAAKDVASVMDAGAPTAEASTVASTVNKPATPTREQPLPPSPAMAAATVMRSVTALRQAAQAGGAASAQGGKPPQRFAATFAKAATASRDAASIPAPASASASPATTDTNSANQSVDEATASTAVVATTDAASTETALAADTDAPSTVAPAAAPTSVDTQAASAAPWLEARRAEAAAAALRAEPELDRARVTAFADTVDALYGVIADQRRAATDHSRRMKWMLSIVVGALLVSVAIGIAQTLLLMRLTRETTAQQHRLEQMMQSQQAAMVSLLDTHAALAAAATANAGSAPAATTPAPQVGATPARGRHARAPHGHRAKAVNPN
ncbi:hypothetical protein [Paraburkholderia antibiotica]|uniref:Cell wall surface anchor family protein n=1 Tax=Paraburkholderia antibiotica TaxID=2728839 RepID=A0A7X9ZYC4_9BURK|nr:hypothetical protein [Paraburkholderia antibiotica]NML31525.1 hypothetical protein [Paraburkholderia antibiotica]